jgi:hypothetical protein
MARRKGGTHAKLGGGLGHHKRQFVNCVLDSNVCVVIYSEVYALSWEQRLHSAWDGQTHVPCVCSWT